MLEAQKALQAQLLQAEDAKERAVEDAKAAHDESALQAAEEEKKNALDALTVEGEEKEKAIAAIDQAHKEVLELAEEERRQTYTDVMKMMKAQKVLQPQLHGKMQKTQQQHQSELQVIFQVRVTSSAVTQ
jgi:hypothetical protein